MPTKRRNTVPIGRSGNVCWSPKADNIKVSKRFQKNVKTMKNSSGVKSRAEKEANRAKRRFEKKELKRKKREDPYGIEDMSDEEFLENLPRLRKKAAFSGVGGAMLLIAAIIVLALLWDSIFWSG